MHRLFITALACLISVSVFGQSDCDKILYKNNELIEVKIVEVTPSEIKYKMCDYLDGPLITTKKKSLCSLTYANGKNVLINKTKEEYKGEKMSLFMELGGPCVIGALNFEYNFINTQVFRLGLSSGVGYSYSTQERRVVIDPSNGFGGPNFWEEDTVINNKFGLGIPISLNTVIGYGNHFLDSGVGITSNFLHSSGGSNDHFNFHLGYRFQPQKKKYLLRIIINRSTDIIDKDILFVPGISYGYRF